MISLRYAGTCSRCGVALPAQTKAAWDRTTRSVTCVACLEKPPAEANSTAIATPAPVALAPNLAGSSAQRIHDRRHDRREKQLEERWGRFAGVAKFLSDDPQKIKSWAKGAAGERKLAASLQKRVGDSAVVLHDRRMPGTTANIDHIAVASSGVWVIDAKDYKGKVEQRNVGGWFRTDLRLYVGGRDRTKLINGMDRQVTAVRNALGIEHDAPVKAVLCFVWSEWNFLARSIKQDGVLVTWPKKLAELIRAPGPLGPDDAKRIAEKLTFGLPPA